MHHTVINFAQRMLNREYVTGRYVLEVGAYDVNGSVRPIVESLDPACYLGVDQVSGPGVDQVANCENLVNAVGDKWDVVITTEMLEHVDDWRKCMRELAKAVVPGGHLLITTRSPGFPYHAYPVDNWRYTQENMHDIMRLLQLKIVAIEDDSEPGVFVFAHKPLRHQTLPDGLEAVDVGRVENC